MEEAEEKKKEVFNDKNDILQRISDIKLRIANDRDWETYYC